MPRATRFPRSGLVQYKVFVCSNMAFSGDFTPVLAKHSKSLNLLDSISVGVDRMQRNFGPMQKQVEAWRETELSNVSAKMIIYEAFLESELEVRRVQGANAVEPVKCIHVGL